MATSRSKQPPSERPDAKSTELSVDHALALSLADETEAALRWGAAALELRGREPDAVLVTSRLLEQMGRRRAAVEGFGLAVGQALDDGNLPLAMAAVGELRALGVDPEGSIERVASTFCRGAISHRARPGVQGGADPRGRPALHRRRRRSRVVADRAVAALQRAAHGCAA